MSVTVTIPENPESSVDTSAVHDATTAAIVEAEHREEVEQTLEEVQESVESWQETMSATMVSMQAQLSEMQTTLSVLTMQQEREAEMIEESTAETADQTAAVEEAVLEIADETASTSETSSTERRTEREKPRFYSPLRSLRRAVASEK